MRPSASASDQPPGSDGSGDTRAVAALLKAASSVTLSATSVDEAMQWAVDLVCDYTGWPLGHIFMRDAQTGALVSRDLWHNDDPVTYDRFVQETRNLSLPPGVGLPGRILASGEPEWIIDVRADTSFVRAEVATECGIGAGFGFPIYGTTGVEGVMEFFAVEAVAPDNTLLGLVSHIGVQLGMLLDRTRADQVLRASEARLLEAQEIAHVGSFSWEVESDTVTWSPELYRIYGLDPADGPATFANYVARVHPDDRDRVVSAVERTIATLEPYEHDYRIVLPDGETRWVHARGEVMASRGDRPQRLTGYCQDISEWKAADERRREAQAELASQQRVLERIARREPLEHTLDDLCHAIEARYPGSSCSVLLVDAERGVLRQVAGPSLPDAFKEAIDELPIAVGMGACGTAAARNEIVVVADTHDDLLTRAFQHLADEYDLRSVWSQPLHSGMGDVLGTFAIYRPVQHRPDLSEITAVTTAGSLAALAIERDLAEKALSAAAHIDPLTGLPNRARFLEQLSACLQREGSRLAVMFLDLDRFKWINDSLGHPAGDRILVEVATRLDRVLDGQHLLARFGGDEFTVLITESTPELISSVSELIVGVFDEPFFLDGGEFFLSVSIGVALNDCATDGYGLVRDADAAMYVAKEDGRGRWAMFDARLRDAAFHRVTLETQLRRAIERDEFVMYYQPIAELTTGRWSGVEALVRWRHPSLGLVCPDDFIPLAEETGLIVPLGLRILDMTVAQAAAWSAALDPVLHVAANIAVPQLLDPSLAAGVEETLRRHGLAPQLLLLEVTETSMMKRLDAARLALEQVSAMGVRVVIDDFGTGYSSIARLGELPVVGVKIDRRFTMSLSTDPTVERVIAAITDLAHALGLDVVAEGVESAHALLTLTKLGCDYAQGYYLAEPVGPSELPDLIRQPPPLPSAGL